MARLCISRVLNLIYLSSFLKALRNNVYGNNEVCILKPSQPFILKITFFAPEMYRGTEFYLKNCNSSFLYILAFADMKA
jgi:hypothetical protein